jgi:hypothetical protein
MGTLEGEGKFGIGPVSMLEIRPPKLETGGRGVWAVGPPRPPPRTEGNAPPKTLEGAPRTEEGDTLELPRGPPSAAGPPREDMGGVEVGVGVEVSELTFSILLLSLITDRYNRSRDDELTFGGITAA